MKTPPAFLTRPAGGGPAGAGDEVGGGEEGVGLPVGEDQRLGRAVDRVDADVAEDGTLREGDEDAAGAADLVDAGKGLGAVGEGGDGLGAAGDEDAVDAGGGGGRELRRREQTVGAWGRYEDGAAGARHFWGGGG